MIADMWLASTNTDYFIRLINIFKQVVVHIINLPSSFDPTEVLSFRFHVILLNAHALGIRIDDKVGYQAQNMS